MSTPVSLFLAGVRVRVQTDAVELVLETAAGGSVTTSFAPDAAEQLAITLIQAAWFAAHGGDLPRPHLAAGPPPKPPPTPKPKSRGRKGVDRG